MHQSNFQSESAPALTFQLIITPCIHQWHHRSVWVRFLVHTLQVRTTINSPVNNKQNSSIVVGAKRSKAKAAIAEHVYLPHLTHARNSHCDRVYSLPAWLTADGAAEHVETHAPPIWWFKTAKQPKLVEAWSQLEVNTQFQIENLIGILIAFDSDNNLSISHRVSGKWGTATGTGSMLELLASSGGACFNESCISLQSCPTHAAVGRRHSSRDRQRPKPAEFRPAFIPTLLKYFA